MKKIRSVIVCKAGSETGDECRTRAELDRVLESHGKDGVPCILRYYDWGAGQQRTLEIADGQLVVKSHGVPVVLADDAKREGV